MLALDPGTTQSAWVLMDDELHPVEFAIEDNEHVLRLFKDPKFSEMAIEWVESYGMAVGVETFETVFWIGRFWEAAVRGGVSPWKVPRREVKLTLCHTSRAKDANVRQALIDRFGPVGTKKNPGWFYGVKSHIFSAVAVGVTFADRLPFDDIEAEDDEG